jgi:hypothetical protein
VRCVGVVNGTRSENRNCCHRSVPNRLSSEGWFAWLAGYFESTAATLLSLTT